MQNHISIEPINNEPRNDELTHDELIKMCNTMKTTSNILDLSNKNITDIKMNKYEVFYSPVFITHLNLLLISEIHLDNNRICYSFENLFNIFQNLTFLKIISISNNNLGDNGAKLLAKYLVLNNSNTNCRYYYNYLRYIEYLDISSNNIGPEGAKAIADALINNKSLNELNMYDNYIGVEGANSFGKMLLSPNIRIKDLNISNNNINVSQCEELAISISKNKSLLFFNISNNDFAIFDEELRNLEKVIMLILSSESISNLFWHNNSIDDLITQYIANGLKKNNTITHLFLSDNLISNLGAYLLFDALKNNCNTIIKHFDLSHNYYIDNECISSFAELLEGNDILQLINMNYTDINNKGLVELSQSRGLKYNVSIVSLTFGKDDIDEVEPIENNELTFILKRNQHIFWEPYNHKYNLLNLDMHNIIITVLLCNTYGKLQVKVPVSILIYLFKFFNRTQFINI